MINRLEKRLKRLKGVCSETSDFAFTLFRVSGIDCALVWFEGMINMSESFEMVYRRLLSIRRVFWSGKRLYGYLLKAKPAFAPSEAGDEQKLLHAVMSGDLALIIDGEERALLFPQQGFLHRAITESYTEENVRAPREGFVEALKINMTLIRRRMKNERLIFEPFSVGSQTKTDVSMVYLKGVAAERAVNKIREKLKSIKIDTLLESGFIEPFFKPNKFSLFSSVGHTERPDTLCAKIGEGRVGIIVDGTPFALIVPSLFIENFQSFDDYTAPAYYASFIRIIKCVCFFISILLPGLYVAVANFNPEILPEAMLKALITAQNDLALPIVAEALFIQLVYEIVREAGLRLPRPIGHAVSLIGALVVGETAITARLVGAPLVMIAALTTICSFVLPAIYQPMSLLRFSFIILGGLLGPMGITVGICAVILNICASDAYGIPFAAPITPADKSLLGDGITRRSWRRLADNNFNINRLPGSKS